MKNVINRKEDKMNQKEAIMQLYDIWRRRKEANNDLDNFSEKEKKQTFLSDAIVGLTTDDAELSKLFGEYILDTLIQIRNQTTFEYIKNEENYKKYITCCNFIEKWIEWGTSIRGAWFDLGAKIHTAEYLGNVGYDKDYIEITEDFIDWFIRFLQSE